VTAFPDVTLRADPVAELTDVSVRRGGSTLLRDVSWTIRGDERWVVLGANGAGKTTLLQVAAGSIRPDAGAVELLGEDLAEADLDDLLPRVGWASAALADRLPPDELVLDVVLTASYATVRRGAERYDKVDELRARDLLTQLGCRAEYGFCAPPPANGTAAHAAADHELERYLHLHALNRGVMITPFHNMALMSPATTAADVDRHTEVFDEAIAALVA